MGYKANTRIKVASEPLDSNVDILKTVKVGEYIEVGEDVSEGDFEEDEWTELVAAKAVLEDEEYERVRPELKLGVNQPHGTPSNMEQITGSQLQVNLPDPEEVDEEPPPPPFNPADPPKVEGAVDPGDGSDSHGQNVEDKDAPATAPSASKPEPTVAKKTAAPKADDK